MQKTIPFYFLHFVTERAYLPLQTGVKFEFTITNTYSTGLRMQRFIRKSMLFFATALSFLISACNSPDSPTLFTELSPAQSNILFSNNITENSGRTEGNYVPSGSRTQSAINEFLYMGGGTGVGDFNNNGRQDIFFAGNQVSSRLYLNLGADKEGSLHFKDITEEAGVTTDVWTTGVSIADINNDGFSDIYVCVYGGKNLLFINNGNNGTPSFTEQAEQYGLADSGDSTQALFFDYNKNGYSDLFLINLRLDGPNPNMLIPRDLSGNSPANDKLYKNMGTSAGEQNPVFENVTKQAGIAGSGYGLGVVATDVNNDGWPDIYVANDYLYSDELWLNNADGTFTNVAGRALRHQSYSSMGVDAADISNSLLPDIITLDMAPEENERKKMQYSFMNYNRYERERSLNYETSFMRNMLHLNNGVREIQGKTLPFFSEIGQYAGISETDWSWSVLAADFTNNGWKDLYITNGSGRDYLNADFIEYSQSEEVTSANEKQRKALLNQKLHSLGFIKLQNYFYLNNGDYTFTNMREKSGLSTPALSNGAAYADIDNDGDLDLIVNNINEPASIFINHTISNTKETAKSENKSTERNHYLQLELTGGENNRDAFGTKALVYAGGNQQMQEKYPVRGYLSSVDNRLLFGLAENSMVDSLVVIWPDDQTDAFTNIPADTLLRINKQTDGDNTKKVYLQNPSASDRLFRDITSEAGIHYKHKDVSYNDYKEQPLLPQKFSQLGPFISTGDVTNNGLTDFFAGGGFNSSGALFKQTTEGVFEYVQFDSTIKYQEDMESVFFDSNGNGHMDLLITYGDTRHDDNSVYYKPRLYVNDGDGNFRLYSEAIPDHVRTIAGTVAAGDFNGDSQSDLFIGGRVSKTYPLPPRSFLLQNENGKFKDVTEDIAPELKNPGMITSAVWADIDGTGTEDLVITGEWMPVRFFKNHHTHLQEVTNQTGVAEMSGFWRSLTTCGPDQEGNIDFVAGNLGDNNRYQVTSQTPLKLYAADLDEDNLIDPVRFYYRRNQRGIKMLYPAINRDRLQMQIPAIQNLFPTHEDYSTAAFDDLFGHLNPNEMLELTVNETRSVYLKNKGNLTFEIQPLPPEVQFAPVDAIVCKDLDDDGHMDLLLAGNEYQTEVRTGQYNASYGLFLKGNSQKKFTAVPPVKSGFIIDGDVKDISIINGKLNKKLVLVAVNNDSLRVYKTTPDANK